MLLVSFVSNLVVFVHDEGECDCGCELGDHVVGNEEDAPDDDVGALQLEESLPAAAAYVEVNRAREHVGHDEDHAQDERVLAVLLVEGDDALDVEHQTAHEEERDDDLEDRDEVEDVVELLGHVARQRDRVHEVDYYDEDQRSYYEHLYLSLEELVATPVDEDQQVVHPKHSHALNRSLTIGSTAGTNRSPGLCTGMSPRNLASSGSASPCQ